MAEDAGGMNQQIASATATAAPSPTTSGRLNTLAAVEASPRRAA
jgi:hypothetical protein